MTAEQIIIKKRNGKELSEDEIKFIINGFVDGEVPDYQMSALLMAIYFQGMNFEEIFLLTKAMIESGETVNLDHLEKFPIDKHSTGGVGDKVSLILAPLMAAAGLAIPMMSGRGLGHSGGTLDKLESIPGFRTNLSLKEYVSHLEKYSVAMIGQSQKIAPADKKIYALRDSTGTVPSIPLVVASIMSKKIAEGAKALVLDVKTGKGAFFVSEEKSLELAKNLIAVGERFGMTVSALMTLMDQPLGNSVGNWLETREAIQALKGNGAKDLMDVTIALGAEMLCQTGQESNHKKAISKLSDILSSGKAYQTFVTMVKSQGGDVSIVNNPDHYPQSKYKRDFVSKKDGYVDSIDALKIGVLATELGAGRVKMSDEIDYTAGLIFKKKEGDRVIKGETIAEVYYSRDISVTEIEEKMSEAIHISNEKPGGDKKLILKYISSQKEVDWGSLLNG